MKTICAAALFLAAAGACAAEGDAMVEIDARLVRATPEQVVEALGCTAPQGSLPLMGLLGVMTKEQVASAMAKLKKSGAEVLDQPRTVVRSGVKAEILGVTELRYPTQFDKDPKTGKQVPVAFESRNVGTTLEYTPIVGPDGQTIDLKIMASIVTFRGFIDYSEGEPAFDPKDEDALEALVKTPLKEGGVWQPVFTNRQNDTTVTVYSGQTATLGFLASTKRNDDGMLKAPALAAGEKQLFLFTTARILVPEE